MNTFLYIVMALIFTFNIGMCIWFVIKSKQSDAAYEKALDEIYGRKR